MKTRHITLAPTFFQDQRVKELLLKLGHRGVYFLIKLWGYAIQHNLIGRHLRGYTLDDIDVMVGWRGRKQKLAPVLLDLGFIVPEEDDGGYLILAPESFKWGG